MAIKNKKTIQIDRTCLNVKISKINMQSHTDEAHIIITNIMSKVVEDEMRLNKPIMDITVDVEEAKILFPEQEIDHKTFLCFV